LKKYKSPGSDQIPAELIQAGGEILLSEIHKLINSVWNKEVFLDQWKESSIVPIHKKGDKTDCNNYRGISLLSTSYKILSNILLSRLVPYIDEIDRLCGLVVRVVDYRCRGPGFDSQALQKKSSGSGTGCTQPREYN
jgi:hypothetical protein